MCYSVVLQREILTRNVSFQRGVWFFEFFEFCLSSLFLLAGNGSAAQTHENTTLVDQKIKIHPFVCPPSRCSFGHFPFVLLGISAQKRKRIYQNDLLLLSLVRARDKNAPLFDEMMRTTTTEKASLCVSCFSSLQRKKKTKKEVGLRVSLRSYAVSCNVILLSRFLSLSFSVSLSLWNDGTDF